ncbi:MAG: hypothetical protein ACP5HM_05895 [Anaerolineae bacterium]
MGVDVAVAAGEEEGAGGNVAEVVAVADGGLAAGVGGRAGGEKRQAPTVSSIPSASPHRFNFIIIVP